MKRSVKMAASVLAAALLLGSFSGCEDKKLPEVQTELQSGCKVTLRVDNKEYVVLDGAGKTVEQLLEQAGVTLADGDSLLIDPTYMVGGELIVSVVRGENQVQQPDVTEPSESTESTKPTGNSGGYQPTPTKPTEPTKPQKEIASIQIYEDCDGSGHGVKVITYTDGTQEEVPF